MIKAPLRTTVNAAKPTVSSRRGLLAGMGLVVLTAGAAHATSFEDKKKEKEARRQKLKQAAETQKETGYAVDAFETPENSISEEARLPNFRMRQSDGTRETRAARTPN